MSTVEGIRNHSLLNPGFWYQGRSAIGLYDMFEGFWHLAFAFLVSIKYLSTYSKYLLLY
jgi:hypothetical protein